MNVSLLISRRYVTASNGKNLVFSVFSVLGIALGIATLIVTLAVMNGVTSDVRDKILSMTAHAKIIGDSQTVPRDTDLMTLVKDEKSILAYAPFIEGQALIGVNSKYNGVQIKGIVPDAEPKVADALVKASDGLQTLKAGEFNVAIGKPLAEQINLSIGDKLTVVIPKMTMSAAGILPRVKRFTVTAFFESGHYLYDTGLVLINIDDAAKLFQRGDNIDGFQLKLDDLFEAQALTERLNNSLPGSLYAFDWTSQNKAYFDAVKAEKAMMFIILMMILLVATFNIFSALIVVVSDKKRDIAILRTLGASPQTIMKIFLMQGLTLCFIATILGVLFGVFVSSQVPNMLAFAENNYGVKLPAELYFISELRPKIEMPLLALIAGSAMGLSFIASLIPAYIASRLQPARALAYE